jgi:peptidyl-prolyl cis-trans isomerase C
MFRLPRILLATSLALAPLAAQAQEPGADTVLATVDGTEITLGHMIDLYSTLPSQYQQLPVEQIFDSLLQELIQQSVLADTVTEPDAALAMRLENTTRQLRAATIITKIAEAAVDDATLKAAYDEQYANAAPGKEFNAAHILVDSKETAEALIGELEGGADFALLAEENSSDTSAANGGDLGWFGLGTMVKPFEDAVLSLKPGEVSGPVESQFGWHIVKLLDERLLETPSFDQVKDELTNDLRRAAVEAEITRLLGEAEVTEADRSAIDPEILRNTGLLK